MIKVSNCLASQVALVQIRHLDFVPECLTLTSRCMLLKCDSPGTYTNTNTLYTLLLLIVSLYVT